jgi:hypothetical protein
MISFRSFVDEMVKIAGIQQEAGKHGKDLLSLISNLGPVGRAAASGAMIGARPATIWEKGWRSAKAGVGGAALGAVGGGLMGMGKR